MILLILTLLFSLSWVLSFTVAKLTGRKLLLNRFNACGLVAIGGSSDDCSEGSGGIVKAYVADLADIDLENATLHTDGSILTLPRLTPSTPFVALTPDANDQASFQQEGSRNDAGSYSTTQTGTLTFANVDHAKYKATEALISCCNLVVVYEWANGFATVQGLRAVKQGDGSYKLMRSIKGAKAIPSINTNTTALDDNNNISLQLVNTDNRLAVILFNGQSTPTVIPATTISDIVD